MAWFYTCQSCGLVTSWDDGEDPVCRCEEKLAPLPAMLEDDPALD